MPAVYYVLALMLGAGLFLWTDRWEVFLLVAYSFLIFALAVLSRSPEAVPHYNLRLFWSWRAWRGQYRQILANILVFVPVGALAGRLWRWRGVLFAAGLSVLIELSQLLSRRGFFEFDDILDNTLGALLGLAACAAFTRLIRRKRLSEQTKPS